jgi:ABC-type nitrate/sulfonate/bicarbonate transport system permease component
VSTLERVPHSSAVETKPDPAAKYRPKRRHRWIAPVVTTAVVILLADLIVRFGLVFRGAFVTVPQVSQGVWDEVQSSAFWHAVWLTMEGWALGLGLAIVIAIPLGIVVGTTPSVYHSLRFVIDFLRPIPSIALIPLFIIIFGITLNLKVYLVAIAAFWPLLFQTIYGVQDVDPIARETARAYRLNGLMIFGFVLVPGATPYIATGLRLAATYALLTAIGSELLVGVPGIGTLIFRSQQAGDTKAVWALIVASGLIGLAITFAFTWIEKRALRWHPSQREEI